MADVNIESAFAVELQAAEDTFETALAGLTTTVLISDGLIFGDARAGLRSTGIDLSTSPRLTPRQPVVGSRTRQDGEFLAHVLDTLTLTLPLVGPRHDVGTGTPIAADFDLSQTGIYPGLDALLRSCGMTGADSGGATWEFTPTGSEFCSVKVWESGTDTGIKDARGVVTLSYTPLEVPSISFAMQGKIEPTETSSATTFPSTVTYGPHLTVAAPGVESLTPTWAGTTRHFTDLTVTIDPGLVDASDSRGFRTKYGKESTITLAGTMVVNNAELNAEIDAMLLASVAVDDFILQVGTTAVSDDDAVAHKITVRNLRPTSAQPVDVAESGCRGIALTAVASATTDGGEFSLEYL